jgi:hypothetical protein
MSSPTVPTPDPEPAETERVTGFLVTEWDCPGCAETCAVEGDATGDTVECDVCSLEVVVREVR